MQILVEGNVLDHAIAKARFCNRQIVGKMPLMNEFIWQFFFLTVLNHGKILGRNVYMWPAYLS